jgi:WD40 repeat protein
VAWSGDSAVVASVGPTGVLRLWAAHSGLPLPAPPPRGPVTAAAFGPRGRLLALAGAGAVTLWGLSGDGPPRETNQRGPAGELACVAFSPQGDAVAAGGADGVVRVWALDRPAAAPALLSGHVGRASAVAFARGGALLWSAGADRTVRLWERSGAGWHEASSCPQAHAVHALAVHALSTPSAGATARPAPGTPASPRRRWWPTARATPGPSPPRR